MSRGPGRLQRLLLHELYCNPDPPKDFFSGRPFVKTKKLAANESELSALYRAARGIASRGWAVDDKYCGGHLVALPAPPPIMANCPICEPDKRSQIATTAGISEHLAVGTGADKRSRTSRRRDVSEHLTVAGVG